MKNLFLKLISVAICLCFCLLFAGCDKEVVVVSIPSSAPSVEASSEPEPQFAVNPLTGLENLDPNALNNRPVAVMVNNLKPTAQQIQTGLDQADIVYEAYAEGGVTRLLAVFKDIKAADQIGSIRSARYSYVDLAMGHDAVYVHAGINSSHATPHVNETGIDNINLLNGKYNGMSFREKNGKALEHTLYTTGEKLWKGFEKLKWRTTLNYNKDNWQSFVPADAEIVPASGGCDAVSVTMSSAYVSKFEYDSANKVYKKFSGTSKHSDYKTGKQLTFKNVLVLKTDVTALSSDGYIVKTGLTGGEGYYVSNGGYQKIKWSKGSTKNPIKITLEDGSACDYNPGNTWVCLVNKKNSVKITEPTSATTSATSK
ncbi:MAG: DUF3048 domain-containing protein [Clostridia bacterium]|nr:DUF3048 domain-containing protein [Clostridia bacterium]